MKIAWGTAFVIAFTTSAAAQTSFPSLFGFTVGDRLTAKHDFTPVDKDRNFVVLSRMSKNPGYLFQTLKLTKKSLTIAFIGASSRHVSDGECDSQLFAVLSQLKRANLGFEEKITDVGQFVHHSLSRPREGCSYQVNITRPPLTVQCASHFTAYCSPDGQGKSTLFVEAGDTGISELGRRESEQAGIAGPDLIK